jgi:hypothetical protein
MLSLVLGSSLDFFDLEKKIFCFFHLMMKKKEKVPRLDKKLLQGLKRGQRNEDRLSKEETEIEEDDEDDDDVNAHLDQDEYHVDRVDDDEDAENRWSNNDRASTDDYYDPVRSPKDLVDSGPSEPSSPHSAHSHVFYSPRTLDVACARLQLV